MKKVLVLISLILISFTLFAQPKLLNYSVSSFGEIARVRLELSEKTSLGLRKEAQNQRIVISLPNARNQAAKSKNYNLPVINTVSVQSMGTQVNISIKTAKRFSEVREYSSSGSVYVVYYDIFNTSDPQTYNELISCAKYYNMLGDTSKYQQYSQKAKQLNPGAQIKNDVPLAKKTEKKVKKATVKPAKKTKKNEKPIVKKEEPKKETSKVNPVEPVKKEEPVKAAESKILTTPAKADSSIKKIIFMKNQMRYPITRPDLKPKKLEKKPEIPVEKQEIKADSIKTEEKPIPVPQPQDTVKAVQADTTTVIPLPINGKHDSLLLDLFQSVETDSVMQNYIIGFVAYHAGANKEATDFLKSIPKTSEYKKEADLLLYDVYKRTGNEIEAKLLYADISADSANTQKTSLLDTPVKAWMALLFSAIVLIVGLIVTMIIVQAKMKKLKPAVSESEFEIHKKHLQRAYENKMAAEKEEPEPVISNNYSQESIVPDYDNPPYVAEDLSHEEEKELEEDEEDFITIVKKDKKESFDSMDDENEGFGDEEYKKKMILKLYNDGWAMEEIAKELQISQREIEFIIKMAE